MTETICLTIDLGRICRCCASEPDFVMDIFADTCLNAQTYCEVLMECAPLQVFRDDGLPAFVCRGCASSLQSFAVFRKKCVESEYILREMLNNLQHIQTEINQANFFDELTLESTLLGDGLSDEAFHEEFLEKVGEAQREADESLSVEVRTERLGISGFQLFENDSEQNLQVFRTLQDAMDSEDDWINIDICDDSDGPVEVDRAAPAVEAERDRPQDDFRGLDEINIEDILNENQADLDLLMDGLDSDNNEDLLDDSFYLDDEFLNFHQKKSKDAESEMKLIKINVVAGDPKKPKPRRKRKAPPAERKKSWYKCDVCDKTFMQKFYLDIHRRIHTGERPFACDLCDKSFRRKRSIEAHRRTHTGEKPFVCERCDKPFSQKYSLDIHRRTHTGERPFACAACDKTFTLKTNLEKHARTHTGEKPFACDLCDKSFTRRRSLRAHRRVHTDGKPHACDQCDGTFALKASLEAHRRSHLGPKPFACDRCPKAFTAKSSLVEHRRIHAA